jgi:hypothetical protein
MNGIPLFEQGDARDSLKKKCREAKIPIKLLEDLVEAEIEQIGKLRKRGLREKFDHLLDPNGSGEGSEGEGV